MFISKKYVPIGNWNNMRPHIFNTISHYFLFEFNLSNLLRLISFLPLEEENCILFPFQPKLTSSIFSIATIHLQLLQIYFPMEKQKCIEMVTLNTLETMIEYTLI